MKKKNLKKEDELTQETTKEFVSEDQEQNQGTNRFAFVKRDVINQSINVINVTLDYEKIKDLEENKGYKKIHLYEKKHDIGEGTC